MKTVVGIFGSPSAAQLAIASLVKAGLPPSKVRQLNPGSSEREVHSAIPTSETEQSGMGRAIGGLVGATFAVTAGLLLLGVIRDGTGQLTSGVLFALAAFALGGGIAGAVAGGALENRMSVGLPKDEIYFYEEALRRGRSAVFALAANYEQEEIAKRVFGQAGAESLDAGDENWHVGLSPAGVHRNKGRRAG